ncbi:MAG: saccharopine dehydrogenase NADP-binding domain-containing protein [Spirochaetales bacterium]|nr:saccharopine dehydrogenase NADP-binding domain-containing protein [Spirochaetales bacterium]
MKKVMVVGVGAQGSTIAKRLDEEANVSEIICADYDEKAAKDVAGQLKKAKAVQLNAKNVEEIIAAAEGCALIVNGLAPDFNMNVMDAALEVGACYQDLASGPVSDMDFVSAVKRCLGRSAEFEAKGLTALMNTGSAPGMANVLTRHGVDKLDSCDQIDIFVYDEIWSNKFIPFWWSPQTAFGDMAAEPIIYKDGEFIRVKPFNNPVMTEFKGVGLKRMVDHEHEEPVTMGLLSDKVLKGVKEVNFRYGGPGLELAESLYKMGLLSEDKLEVKGQEIIPMDIISKLTPPAPKYADEIQAVLDEGMVSEDGVFLVRVTGQKDGRTTKIDLYCYAPGLTDAFKKAGITHESYFTGQAAFLFTKMFVNDVITTKGCFPPECLEEKERTYYLSEAAKLDLLVDEIVETRLY